MKLRQAVEKIMDFAKENECDVNLAFVKMAHLINTGKMTDITGAELDNANRFLKVHYDEAVAARKGKSLDKYQKALAAWGK